MMYSTREISPDAMWKPARNKGKHTEGQCMETSGSTQECNWVVGLQILTSIQIDASKNRIILGNSPSLGLQVNRQAMRTMPVIPLMPWSSNLE